MKILSNNTDINKGQQVPSINLNLQTEVSQYLVQQGQSKEGGGGEGNKTSSNTRKRLQDKQTPPNRDEKTS